MEQEPENPTSKWHSTYETTQPWVVYHFGLTHDRWWPIRGSTRWWGRAHILTECAVCGKRQIVKLKIPRFRPIPDLGHHPKRTRLLEEHFHPDRGAPMSWAMPLLNPAAHPGGLDLDQFAMRLEADLNEERDDG